MSRINYDISDWDYKDTGCAFHPSCLKCPYPYKVKGCLLEWTVEERQAYFKKPENVLDIKFGSEIGKKHLYNKFGLTPCPQCGKRRFVNYPDRLGVLCFSCSVLVTISEYNTKRVKPKRKNTHSVRSIK